jgi:hypothetical protein
MEQQRQAKGEKKNPDGLVFVVSSSSSPSAVVVPLALLSLDKREGHRHS